VRLAGYFSVFGQWTEIRSQREGNFLERVAPGAFTQTIARDRSKMRVLFEHGIDPLVGAKPLGPVSDLRQDGRGAYYESELFDVNYVRELVPALQAGQFGSSFRFAVTGEEFVARPQRSSFNPRGLPERTVTGATVREFGPTIAPAYQGADASVRSASDVPIRQGGIRLEEVSADLGSDPGTPVTLRRLRKAAKTNPQAAELLRSLERGDKVELRWHDIDQGESFRAGKALLRRRVALAPEKRSRLPSERPALYGQDDWQLEDPDEEYWRLGQRQAPYWRL